MQVLVLGVNQWDFQDRETGKQVQGCKITYATGDRVDQPGRFSGYEVYEMGLPVGIWSQFPGPGLYDVEMSQRRGQKGRAELVITGGRLVAALDLAQVVQALQQQAARAQGSSAAIKSA